MNFDKWPFSQQSTVVSVIAVCYFFFFGFDQLHNDGQVGATKKNGFGCTCHGFPESPDVKVWIEGPSRIQKGTTHSFVVSMTGGPAVMGGYNVAAQRGAVSPGDTTSQLLPSTDGMELTHVMPKEFINDTVRWIFLYQAPADTTEDTLFSVGNSTDGNGVPPGDAFNFGENFIVDLFGDSSLSVDEEFIPSEHALLQNYPNPFNPATNFEYRISEFGFVSLKIYDLLGREVAVLVDDVMPPGSYLVEWNGSGMPSGIYLYRLHTKNFSSTKKMLLLR